MRGKLLWSFNRNRCKRLLVVLPECRVEAIGPDLPKLLKPIFAIIWNAFGYLQSLKYD
jgi:hypothetical protein